MSRLVPHLLNCSRAVTDTYARHLISSTNARLVVAELRKYIYPIFKNKRYMASGCKRWGCRRCEHTHEIRAISTKKRKFCEILQRLQHIYIIFDTQTGGRLCVRLQDAFATAEVLCDRSQGSFFSINTCDGQLFVSLIWDTCSHRRTTELNPRPRIHEHRV